MLVTSATQIPIYSRLPGRAQTVSVVAIPLLPFSLVDLLDREVRLFVGDVFL